MRHVGRAEVGGHLAQGHELIGVGKGARLVIQAGRERDGPVLERLVRDLLHRPQLFGCGLPVFPPDQGRPHASMRHVMRRVAGRRALERVEPAGDGGPIVADRRIAIEGGEVVAEGRLQLVGQGCIADSVKPQQISRDALAHLGLVRRLGQQHQVRVRVHVDESRADHSSAGVDLARAFIRDQSHGGDACSVDGDAAAVAGSARAVDDARVTNHQVMHGHLRMGLVARSRSRPAGMANRSAPRPRTRRPSRRRSISSAASAAKRSATSSPNSFRPVATRSAAMRSASAGSSGRPSARANTRTISAGLVASASRVHPSRQLRQWLHLDN